MRAKLILGTLMLAGTSLFAAPRIAFGVGIGVPAPVVVAPVAPAPVVVTPPVVSYVPPCPGPGYVWIGGNWVFRGGPGLYRPGYWHGRVYGPRYFRHR